MMRTLLAVLLLLSSPALADLWTVDPAQSSLSVTTQVYEGAPFIARFETWEADVTFDPADLAAASVTARIATASFTAAEADDALFAFEATGADWFFSEQFPLATFQSQAFQQTGEGAYTVAGTLTLKDLETPLTFPFTLSLEGDTATMRAQIPLNRQTLNLGQATHPNETTVANEVILTIELLARRQDQQHD